MRNVQFHASTDNYKKGISIIALFENYVTFVKLQGMRMICEICFFFAGQVFKESDFINVGFSKLVVFLNDLLHGLLEYLMRDA